MNPLVAAAVIKETPTWAKVAIGIGVIAVIGGTWYAIDSAYFKEERQARKAEKKSEKKPFWDKDYCEEHRKDLTLSASDVSKYANEIYDALHGIGFNNVDTILAKVNLCKNGADWSYICRSYALNKNMDLFDDLSQELNNEDKKRVFGAVKKLK